MDVQGGAVGRRNSGGFLPAMLEGIKSQIGELGRFYAAKYAKYAAFIVEVIVRQLKGCLLYTSRPGAYFDHSANISRQHARKIGGNSSSCDVSHPG